MPNGRTSLFRLTKEDFVQLLAGLPDEVEIAMGFKKAVTTLGVRKRLDEHPENLVTVDEQDHAWYIVFFSKVIQPAGLSSSVPTIDKFTSSITVSEPSPLHARLRQYHAQRLASRPPGEVVLLHGRRVRSNGGDSRTSTAAGTSSRETGDATPPPSGLVLDPLLVPSVQRRAAAKFIDFVGVALAVVGYAAWFHSYFGGLLIGYAWLALSDWGGSWGKSMLGLKTVNRQTGRDCSALESVLRNLPFIVAALPGKLHQAMLGMDRHTYAETHLLAMLLWSLWGLAWFVAILMVANSNPERRQMGDFLARTIVLRKRVK